MISTTVVIMYCLLKPYAATHIILLQLFTLSGGTRGGPGAPLFWVKYNTIRRIRLFFYASHTQQKLVSRWGVGKHITLQ